MDDRRHLVEIGELAQRTRTSASALRYYETLGLLAPDERRGGRRRYSEAAAERVALIRLCQDVGFRLGEIRELLRGSPRAWTRLAEEKIRELDELVAQAAIARAMLVHALECPSPDLLTCPQFRGELHGRLR
jgi:DNA-binding transcriptional MerR regulator